MILLTADWHLTDNPQDEYRWQVFDTLNSILVTNPPMDVFILGDICDKKDRHSSALVNRLIKELHELPENAKSISIIMGNHDIPMRGLPYWDILNYVKDDRIGFYPQPDTSFLSDIALLPYTDNPVEAWAKIDFNKYKAVFMHQPVNGAPGNNGHKLDGFEMPVFLRKLKIYSGDIHTPGKIGRVEYVGAPHHIKYGDAYRCRALILNDDYEIEEDITLQPQNKTLANIETIDDLALYKLGSGDQVKIRMQINANELEDWPKREAALLEWGSRQGVHISSIEAIVKDQYIAVDAVSGEIDPLTILAEFGASEGLSDRHIEIGLECLEAVQNV